ncbi:MAG: NADH-quinone oxidoreductase subunit C [Bernardetiaceae bacterium]|jgi:NADH-quinone oxidoreductase subunit C|nr:NADH-quinone oxidoreductase subunit C [Bernardetiaceae bacterium]
MPLAFPTLTAQVRADLGPHCLLGTEADAPQPAWQLAPEQLLPVASWLLAQGFDHLACLTAVDHGPAAERLELVYHLYAILPGAQLVLKVALPRPPAGAPLPVAPSVAHLWRAAEWHEREAYDLMGIGFSQHPDLRRILLPADWTGHPLRKDDTPPTTYHGVRVAY